MSKKIALLTSGGDAPGMNAAIRAIVLAADVHNYSVLGFYHGYNGLINDESCQLSVQSVDQIIHLGGTLLKSARCPEMLTETGVKQAVNVLMKNQIDALIVVGGDGSFSGLLSIEKLWNGITIGIPGTIDNDVDGTDHTIGFATAVNTALSAIDKIRDTANAFDRVFLVELMGRHSGHITFNVGIACAAEHVMSFENTNIDNPEKVVQDIAESIKSTNQAGNTSFLTLIAENLWPSGSQALARQISNASGVDCTLCTLGYIQRGGSPVAKDRILATKLGVAAISAIKDNKSSVMVGEQNNAIVFVPIKEAVLHKKTVNPYLIEAQQNILATIKPIDR